MQHAVVSQSVADQWENRKKQSVILEQQKSLFIPYITGEKRNKINC